MQGLGVKNLHFIYCNYKALYQSEPTLKSSLMGVLFLVFIFKIDAKQS
jgi:hypothetical protein